jgi:hypothetical protein
MKEMKDLLNENYKSLKKEIEDIRRWKERPSMPMDQQNQYCENGYTTKSNLHVQCNPYQNSNDRDRKINPKVYMEAQKISNSPTNCEQQDATMLELSQYLTSHYTTEP